MGQWSSSDGLWYSHTLWPTNQCHEGQGAKIYYETERRNHDSTEDSADNPIAPSGNEH